ncbi:MAG: hypothetical protein V9G19_08630 [Tetrasphaera sp.]
MHQRQGRRRASAGSASRSCDQAGEDTRAALGRFVDEERAAVVAGGQGFAEHFAFFQLDSPARSPRRRACWIVAIVSGVQAAGVA